LTRNLTERNTYNVLWGNWQCKCHSYTGV